MLQGLFNAILDDESQVVTCFDSHGEISYLSPSYFKLLGTRTFDSSLNGDGDEDCCLFVATPSDGALFFRPKRDGGKVQFQNTFWCQLSSGELYTIDKVVSSEKNPLVKEDLWDEKSVAIVDPSLISTPLEMRMFTELEYLREFRNNAPLSMYSIDATCKIVWANKAMFEMMGYTGHEEEYIGSNSIHHHVDQVSVNGLHNIVFPGGVANEFPCRVMTRDGRELEVLYNSSSCRSIDDGSLLYSTCIVRDVTEKNRLLKEKEKLEEDVALLKEKSVSQLSAMKSDFLAHLAEELTVPITGITKAASYLLHSNEQVRCECADFDYRSHKNYLGTSPSPLPPPPLSPSSYSRMVTRSLSEEQKACVEIVEVSGELLASLIRNILDIPKLDKGTLQLESRLFVLEELVKKVCKTIKVKIALKELNLVVNIGDELLSSDTKCVGISYVGDPDRLAQVLLNMLSSAVRYTTIGHVECKVNIIQNQQQDNKTSKEIENMPLFEGKEDGSKDKLVEGENDHLCYDMVLFEINDTGVGREGCDDLFLGSLYKPCPPISGDVGDGGVGGCGSNLDLSISCKLVELMGGTMGIQSVAGKGTNVWVKIPLRKS